MNELTEKEEAGALAVLPDDFLTGEGFDGVDAESQQIPFLRIAQKMTSQVDEADASYIEGLKPGMFYNNVAGKSYGKEVRVVLLHYFRNFTKWGNDLGSYKGTLTPEEFDKIEGTLSRDGGSFTTPEGDRIQDTRNFFVILPDHLEDGPMLFTLTSTGIKPSKMWLTRAQGLRLSGKKPALYASIWNVSTMQCSNDYGTWYSIGDKKTLKVDHDGYLTGELVPVVKEAYSMIRELESSSINYGQAVETTSTFDDEEDTF